MYHGAGRVAIIMPAFNVARYVAQAIESVLAQRIDVPYRLYIAEDCSTDNTKEVCERYARLHPEKVVLICNPRNLGLPRSFSHVHNRIEEEYFCVLDGDDYFTSPDKLAVQHELLETQPDVAVCAHNVDYAGERDWLDYLKLRGPVVDPEIGERYFTAADVARGSIYFATASLMYRNVFKQRVPQYFYEERGSDEIIRTIVHAGFGKIAYLPTTMAAWRIRNDSRWNGLSRQDQLLKLLQDFANWNEILDYEYDQQLAERSRELIRQWWINQGGWIQLRRIPRRPLFHTLLAYRGARNIGGHWVRRVGKRAR